MAPIPKFLTHNMVLVLQPWWLVVGDAAGLGGRGMNMGHAGDGPDVGAGKRSWALPWPEAHSIRCTWQCEKPRLSLCVPEHGTNL